MFQQLINKLVQELQMVTEDDEEARREGIDEFEDQLAEAWRNGYSRALQVVIEEEELCTD